jgi:predicted transposase YbfD/YdcC
VAVADKSNEITAIPTLLRLSEREGALVSIDALGCQTEIARAVRASGADYLLQVKGNRPTLRADVAAAFAAEFVGLDHDVWCQDLCGHGREEERVCLVLYDLEKLSTRADWVDLRSLVRVIRTAWDGGEETVEVAYDISSRRGSAEELGGGDAGALGD